ncbi:MAG TPA: FAD-binding and (Fe-S)-binding domain-containing protein [Chloroflexota bacterium]|nr:FAD-binding and (Fe-S)-binding domain-containing protein [Chloroflexota bacterium]
MSARSALTIEQQTAIQQIVTPARARFDPRERHIYSHDTGVLPPLMRPLLGKTLADGVAQPETEQQVIELVRLARRERIPLVPRGKATSGYGGAVPAAGGLVVDLTRLRGIVAVDEAALTATVLAGTVWTDLEDALRPHGLALRLYPTSAPGSTVGGWLAQGGAGIGSNAYGWFKENVVSARVAGGDGEVRTLGGSDLAGIADAEGTTGIITEVTLRVRPDAPQVQTGVSFPDAKRLSAALREVIAAELPIWSVSFINPALAAFRNAGLPKTHHGHPLKPGPRLPEQRYVVLFAHAAADQQKIVAVLRGIAQAYQGERLPGEAVRHEWAERFKPLRLKRFGPSIVPAEVVVPVSALAETLEDLTRSIHAPLAIEGLLVRGGEVVLLGFIPHDERRISYNLGYGFALTAIAVAERHGGRAYATGRYFGAKAKRVLGGLPIAAVRARRAETDPAGILNPGKVVFGNGAIGLAIRIAGLLAAGVGFMANLLGRPPVRSPKHAMEVRAPRKGFPADVSYYAYACAQCGYCVDTCTLYQARGWESSGPRGKWFLLKEMLEGRQKLDQEAVNTFLMCTTCEKCDVVCQLDLPVESSWAQLRGTFVQEKGYATFPPFEIMGAALKGQQNIWGGMREDRDAWVPEELKPKIKERARVAYFAGCTASFVEQDIAQASALLLDKAGVEFTTLGKDEMCCGIPMLVAGKWDLWEASLRHNVAAMREHGAEEIVTSCPACWLVWSTYYPQWAEKLGIDFPFAARHYSELLSEKLAEGALALTEMPASAAALTKPGAEDFPVRVTFHDSCHIGRAGGVYEPPRDLVRATPGVALVEMAHSKEDALCCGSVLTRIGEPEPTSNLLGGLRVAEAQASGADALLALCPCCEFQLRVSADNAGADIPVVDLARFTAEAAGFAGLPDPNPEVRAQWAMFERFIALMTPAGMTGMMVRLTPQLLDAMPLGMGAMMRGIGRLPAPVREPLFKAMGPLLPVLFPVLLPGMMPKVLPHMIREVERDIPMPDYLRAQLPDLFPEVVDRVMPKMLPEVAPAYVPHLFAHLRA